MVNEWDGDMAKDHTIQDEWALARENGWERWTTDEDGQMVEDTRED